jgi:two-component system, NtrC family, nitrogen regulation sensor histidine kinase NtrY
LNFRRKLLAVFTLTVVLSVAGVALLVSAMTRRAFARNEDERSASLMVQFQHEFDAQGKEIARRLEAIAASDPVAHMAALLNHSSSESAGYFDLAKSLAENYELDFLEFVDANGTIVSSAQWPAKFGYPETAFANLTPFAGQPSFLKQEELQDTSVLGLFAVRATRIPDHPLYVIGGRRLDKNFLATLNLPDTRVFLYQNQPDNRSAESLIAPSSIDPSKAARTTDKLTPLINATREARAEMTAIVHWSSDAADDEMFHAIPLRGKVNSQPLLGILLIGNSRRSYVELERRIRASALLVGGGGIVLAILLSSWAAARVTRPVERLAHAAQEVAAGNWSARVAIEGNDELSQLADSFNRMTAELLNQKERLVQAERVAAWRELARRLAHELKNPLFPLQLTVENLLRARQNSPEEFDEVFRESSATLLAEISNLKVIIGRFSEFSKMPQPQLQPTDMNELLRGIGQLFRAQLQAPERKPIECILDLDGSLRPVPADAELLHRALSNLVLNAMDAMPDGGTLTLCTHQKGDGTVIEIADTGSGLTPEECERIFTPYYTSKQHGTGLGLAIVQSVVSDHKGTINVHSEPGKGTRFVIGLPENLEPSRPSDAQQARVIDSEAN